MTQEIILKEQAPCEQALRELVLAQKHLIHTLEERIRIQEYIIWELKIRAKLK